LTTSKKFDAREVSHHCRELSDFKFAENDENGTGMDQKYAKVRLLFTLKNYARPRFFKHLRPGMLVRDEGVAGSNPATPTNT
jgi:hypothetical protein